MSSQQPAYAHKLRSTRIDKALPVEVQGVGALREPYQEHVSTQTISCHGCTYQTKHEVIQGEAVFLGINPSHVGAKSNPSRARVKLVQRLGTPDRGFQVAVELESAGNVWGIDSPPEDWFPVQKPSVNEAPAAMRELRVVPRTEQKIVSSADSGAVRPAGIDKQNGNTAQYGSLAHLMAGIGEQIQNMSAEAARDALAREKSKQLDEFRAQLRDEAAKTVQAVISVSKEDIARHALKALMEAHEAGARNNHARWIKQIEQDLETARQHLVRQVKEVTDRIDSFAASTTDRVQGNMDSAREEAVNRFVSRFREAVTPLLAEANNAIQSLAASEAAFKQESESLCAGIESQLAAGASASLAKAQTELDVNATVVSAKTNETLLQLSRDIEKAAQENLQALLASMQSQMSTILHERTAEISREFSAGIEGYARNYLEFVGKSIAEIPRNAPGHSNQE